MSQIFAMLNTKLRKPLRVCACIIAIGLSLTTHGTYAASKAKLGHDLAKAKLGHDLAKAKLGHDLAAADPETVSRAVSQMRLLHSREAIDGLRSGWLKRLQQLSRFEDVIEITQYLIGQAPYYTDDMAFLISAETRAQLKLGRTDEAIKNAKRLYFVASMTDMESAMQLMAECLGIAMHSDPNSVKRFKSEQIEGYLIGGRRSAVLDAIQVDVYLYGAAPTTKTQDDLAVLRAGNMMLLAGKADEAFKLFSRAVVDARTPRDRWERIADVARAMKAQDGTVGRANAFLRAEMVKLLDQP
jgi:tetratricopeptide (TPR) repeat protein